MKTIALAAIFALTLQDPSGAALKITPGQVKAVVTAVAAGVSAVGFGESGAKDELRTAYRDKGIDPVISATFDVMISLNADADAVYWADTVGSADLFFVMQGGGKNSLAPLKFDGFKGGTIKMQLQGDLVQQNQLFALHIFDDDTVWGDAFSALLPKRISPTAGFMTSIGTLEGKIEFELQGGRVEIKDPDYIGAIAFTTPNDKQWTVSGKIVDQYHRQIGTFEVTQHPMDGLGVLHSSIARFVGYSGAAIAALIGLPFLVSRMRRAYTSNG